MIVTHDRTERRRADRFRIVGCVLLLIALGLWARVAWLLFVPFEVHSGRYTLECDSPALFDGSTAAYAYDNGKSCSEARSLPGLLATTLIGMPLATLGSLLFAMGSARFRAVTHAAQRDELMFARERQMAKNRAAR
ncbi:hypothetical protein ABT160_28400 [Streptomyces sp. NPDC001941]|uniref:hypothetical protein n=1 Tax=Streptomyces sp. NPDC001941 TaxID=3154659 RepID=UPI0033272C1F